MQIIGANVTYMLKEDKILPLKAEIRVTLPKLVIPYPNAKGGRILSIQLKALAQFAEPQLIHLKITNMKGTTPPKAKFRKYTVACAFEWSLNKQQIRQVKGMFTKPNNRNKRIVAP